MVTGLDGWPPSQQRERATAAPGNSCGSVMPEGPSERLRLAVCDLRRLHAAPGCPGKRRAEWPEAPRCVRLRSHGSDDSSPSPEAMECDEAADWSARAGVTPGQRCDVDMVVETGRPAQDADLCSHPRYW
mmetsp:Transcript_30688/g.81416  ORF Transcript_30688/g.81416 Transcript_30688/m.81416 type:complete len:130 (+) Transcript_30688:1-390(+)